MKWRLRQPNLPWAHAYLGAVTYRLALPVDGRRRVAMGWLGLGIISLIGSGLFSLLLVLARTPGVNRFLPAADFFRVALVVHVDLSVLVWFTAFAGIFWNLTAPPAAVRHGWSALGLCALGTLGMSASAFLPGASPVMANYVPILDSPWFLASLMVFGAGAALMIGRALLTRQHAHGLLDGAAVLRLGLLGAAASAAVALFAFLWSWLALPTSLDAKTYFELLFWGGGHVLQFTWTLLLLVAWLWLADAIGIRLPFTPRVTLFLFAMALVAVLATPAAYLLHDVSSVEHRRMLTMIMRIGGGLSIVPIVLGLVVGFTSVVTVKADVRPLRAALIMSLTLFCFGGLIGMLIRGSSVTIPAHYHGCIVGITLAFMGVTYELLPRLGMRAPSGRIATLQPYLYGIGQLMHICGLVWSGGYGVQRKVSGADQILDNFHQVAGMALMGLGGTIAIIGGLLFIMIVIASAVTHRSAGRTGQDSSR